MDEIEAIKLRLEVLEEWFESERKYLLAELVALDARLKKHQHTPAVVEEICTT